MKAPSQACFLDCPVIKGRLPNYFIQCVFVLLALFTFLSTTAQTTLAKAGFFVKHYSQEDGMAGGGGYLLHKDSRGFLWMGGFEGLSRFDGRNFTNFTKNDGFFENSIGDLREDKDGLIYASTVTGVYRYTGNANHPFVAYHLPIVLNLIAQFYPVDSNHIYIADDNTEKLYLFDGKKMHTVAGFTGHSMRMELDKAGFLYVFSTYKNPLYIIKDTQVVAKLPPPLNPVFPNGQYFAEWLHKNADGQVIYSGYKRYLLQGHSPYIMPYHPLNEDSTYYNYLLSVENTYASIQYFNGRKKWEPVNPIIGNTNFNSNLLATEKSNLYFLSAHGLDIFYPKLYASYKRNTLLQYFTTTNGCKVLHNDSALYKNSAVYKTYYLLKNIISAICLGHNGTVWFNTKRGVYYLINGKGQLKHYIPPIYKDDFTVKYALDDEKGNTWFETYGGILKYDGKQFTYWARKYDLMQAIYSSVIDRHGIYYVAGLGIFAFVNSVPKFIGDELGIGRQIILSLTLDNEKNVWVKTSDTKLLKIGVDAKNNFSVADSILLELNGKPFIAQSIAFDSADNLWATSNNQLSVYLKQPNGRYNNAKKLVLGKEQQLYTNTLITDEARTNMYLRNDSLCSVFNVHALLSQYTPRAANVQLLNVQLFKKDIDWPEMGIRTDKYGLPINPTFTSKQNYVSFLFTGIADAEQHVMYQYKLDGLDSDWLPTTQLTEAIYTSLLPGKYVFYVRAANTNGVWSEPMAFPFTILSPWYFTFWAWVAWLILGGAFVFLMYRVIKKRVQKQHEIERIIMEHQLKALRAQINPHFLQNTFEFLLQTVKKQPITYVEQVIDSLSSYLRNVLDLTDVTVLTLENELIFADEYLTINRLIFRNSFDFTITVAEEVDTVNIKLPSMMLQPILENAIKHGVRFQAKNKHARIDIKIYADNRFIYCMVSNTINTAPQTAKETKYLPKGIKITEERLELLYKKAHHAPYIESSTVNSTYQVVIGIPI